MVRTRKMQGTSGPTDRPPDRPTDRPPGDSYIPPPKLRFWGYKKLPFCLLRTFYIIKALYYQALRIVERCCPKDSSWLISSLFLNVSISIFIFMFLIITQIICEKVQYSSKTVSRIMSPLNLGGLFLELEMCHHATDAPACSQNFRWCINYFFHSKFKALKTFQC
jgi:hypothetical protein